MSVTPNVSTWIELVAGVLLIVMGGVRWFAADPPGPGWFRGTGSREVRRQRGRANVVLGLGLLLLVASTFANAANRPVVGAPLTLAAIVALVGSVVLNVRATKLERSAAPAPRGAAAPERPTRPSE